MMMNHSRLWLLLGFLLFALCSNEEEVVNCGMGCLSCSPDNSGECRICDIFHFYIRQSNGSCTKNEIENCEVASLSPSRTICLLCESGYVVDFVQGKCVAVHFSKLIDECERYSSFGTCDSCNPGNFMQGGMCTNSTSEVKNCERYSANGICSGCDESYFLMAEENACSKYPRAKNCEKYNRNSCDECQPGYTKDLNFYLRLNASDSVGQNLALSETTDPQVFIQPDDICFPNQVTNCKVFSTPTECAECESKHFLTADFQCDPYPVNQIKNCITYTDAETCKVCNELYYQSGGECVVRQASYENCEDYDYENDFCWKCVDGYYLMSVPASKICTKRTENVENCVEYKRDDDVCSKCHSNYVMADDELNCFSKIDNCKEYEKDTSETDYKKCTECDAPYFLLENTPQTECTKEKYIAYCKERVDHKNECEECESGFFKELPDKCSPHSANLCLSFKPNENVCNECLPGFEVENDICVPIVKVDNCANLSSVPGECTTCNTGYYLSEEKLCLLTNLVGCLSQVSNKNECGTCDTNNGFYKDTTENICYYRKVANCDTLSESSHGCAPDGCAEGYDVNVFGTCSKVSTDLSACQSSKTATRCIACDNKVTHFLNPLNNECVERMNTSCGTAEINFDQFADICLKCEDPNTLINGFCEDRSSIDPKCEQRTFNTAGTDNVCNQCELGYILTKQSTCLKQDILGCIDYDRNNFGCIECDTNFILNDFTKMCEKVFIPNCLTYEETAFECKDCEDSFFLGSDKRCYQYTMQGCETLNSDNHNACDACMTGFDGVGSAPYSACVIPSNTDPLENCDFIDAGTCITCDSGYYIAPGNVCVKQNIPHCTTYVANQNSCSVCENFYYPVDEDSGTKNKCEALQIENCVETDGMTSNCAICLPNYVPNSSSGCDPIDNPPSMDLNVEGCFGNDNMILGTNCSDCKPGFMKAKLFSYNLTKLAGCQYTDLDDNGLFCNLCLEYYEYEPVSRGCKPLSPSYSGECIQAYTIFNTMQEVEDNNKECLKCRNEFTHFTNDTSDGCTQRTNIVINCEVYDPHDDTCAQCPYNTIYSSLSSGNSLNLNFCLEYSPSSSMKNCAVYSAAGILDPADESCVHCAMGYYGPDCSSYVEFEDLLFDNKFILDYSGYNLTNEASYTNAERTVRGIDKATKKATNVIGTCKKGFVPSRYEYEENSALVEYDHFTTFNPILKRHELYATFSVIEECLDITTIPLHGAGDADFDTEPVVKQGLCGLVTKIGDGSKYMCTACIFGYIAKIKKILNGPQELHPVVECIPATEANLYKQYTGLGYKIEAFTSHDINSSIYPTMNLEQIIHYDSCSNGMTPVAKVDYFSKKLPFEYFSFGDSDTSHLAMECADIDSSYKVNNCQVYISAQDIANYTTSGEVVSIWCVSCKPGYKKVAFDMTMITTNYFMYAYAESCIAIENCDLESSENTAMNMCNKCKTGYSWAYNGINNSVNFDECVAENPNVPGSIYDPNCKIFHYVYGNKCVLCQSGYMNNDLGKCVEQTDFNCDEIGFQKPTFYEISGDSSSFNESYQLAGYLEIMNLIQIEYNKSNKTSQNCNSCKAGTSLMNVDHSACIPINVNYDTVVGCLKFGIDGYQCYECKDEYVLVDNMCLSWNDSSDYIGCEQYESSSPSYCKYYVFPYYLVTDITTGSPSLLKIENTSIDYFVSDKDTNNIVCIPGYVFSYISMKCELIAEDDDCNQYYCDDSSHYCVCIECKDPKMMSITYKSSDYHINTRVKCFYPSFVSKTIETAHYFVIPPSMNPTIQTGLISQCIAFQHSNPFALSSVLLSTVDNHNYCVPEVRTELNCKEYNSGNLWECTSCPDLYYLNELKECVKGDVPFCTKYHDTDKNCLACAADHFLDATQPEASKCSPYTHECATFSETADQCLTCPSYLKLVKDSNENMACVPYSVDNCLHYSKTDDTCLLCREGFFKDPADSLCKPIALANCSVYNLHSNTCSQCKEGFYLNSSYECQVITATNCLTYSNSSNACLSCPSFFYLDSTNNCAAIMIIGCEIPQVNANQCAKCADGFYKDTNQLCIPYTATHCSIYKPGEDQCFMCDNSSFMNDSSQCVQYGNATNCESYHPTKDACVSCIEAFYLDTTGDDPTCLENTSVYCQEYHKKENKCVNCLTNYFLNDSEKCVPITAQNCLTSMGNQDKCETCSQEFYLNSETGSCVPYTVFNCAYYNLYKNECATCKAGYYFDKGSCLNYTAKNCSTFSSTSNTCDSCNKGYYLDVVTLLCTPYTVNGCSSFNPSENSCISCPKDFYRSTSGCSSYTAKNCLRKSVNADLCIDCVEGFYFKKGHCLPYTTENCADYLYNKDLCLSCIENHFFEFGMCYPYTAKNCATYVYDSDLCLTCDMTLNNGHVYHKDNLCLFHTEIEGCIEYSPDSDKCLSCDQGFYFEDNMCVENPTGIPNCAEYRAQDECKACEDNYYLRDNVCHSPNEAIPNCLKYLTDTCCLECESGFSTNVDGICIANEETSCLTNSDAFNCETCNSGEVLTQNNSNHLVCEPSNIANCVDAVKTATGLECQQCESGYFSKKDECVWPLEVVENCQEYSDHGICSKCQANHVLSSNNKHCSSDMSQVGDKCLLGSISDKPFCSRCEGGFLFNSSGQCIQCAEEMLGCAICDIKDLNYCLICQSGYYMNTDRECLEYPEPDDPTSISIISMLSIWTFIMTLFA